MFYRSYVNFLFRSRIFKANRALSLSIFLVFGLHAAIVNAESPSQHVNVDVDGFSISRYDPVAYFTAGRPVRGNTDINAEYHGAKFAFSSEVNRELFLDDPEKYTPQYGGYCAFGVAHGSKSNVDPEVWEIVDDRLYLLLSGGTHSIWQQKQSTNIQKADEAWKIITVE